MDNSSLAQFVDTHCHLEMEQFDHDRDEMIRRAGASGIGTMITVGSDLEGAAKAIGITEQYENIFAAVGVHPHEASKCDESVYQRIRALASHKKVVAVGETGLDYHYDHSSREVQRDVFRKHLQLASDVNLPVIIHCRDAWDDTIGILKETGGSRGVMHCFSGDRKMAAEVISLGYHLSIAGPVTFKKSADLREVARLVPDEYLLLETDAPYLSPEPYRGKRNEPAHLVQTARLIAELRTIGLEDLARITSLNAKRLFGIGRISEKAEIAYKIRNSLYLNITNRCTNACTFCVKFHTDYVKGHKLRLDREPSEAEVREAIGDPSRYTEVVFCGYGEPLSRLDLVKGISLWVKQQHGKIRVNTNGQANLIHKRSIICELKGLVDSISISLDAHDEETYTRICRPVFPNAFHEVLRFIREAKDVIPEVRITVVALEGVDIEKCRSIASVLGVGFKVRTLDVVG